MILVSRKHIPWALRDEAIHGVCPRWQEIFFSLLRRGLLFVEPWEGDGGGIIRLTGV